MEGTTEAARDSNTPGSESRSKPRVDDPIAGIMHECGVSKRFLLAEKADINPKIWNQIQAFMSGESLFIHGSPGVGKTHIASALVREKILREQERILRHETETGMYFPIYPRMISVPDLLLEIRETFNGRTGEGEAGLIERSAKRRSLILDDLGVEKTSEWSMQTLYSIIDRRYRDMRQTLITSNLTLDEIAEKVGDRIASRIAGMCKVVEIKGKDRRLKN